jgi:hypothetical protein
MAKEYRRNLERFILPALGQLTVTGITRADVAKFQSRPPPHPLSGEPLPGIDLEDVQPRRDVGVDSRIS